MVGIFTKETAELIRSLGYYQEFTKGEQACISGKISKGIEGGKERDQAIAIAISECAPGKAMKDAKMSDAAQADKTNAVVPGGQYEARENPDGSWNIFNVPVFAEHDLPEDPSKRIGRRWMDAALQAADKRFREDSYLPPLHINHHLLGKETRAAGLFKLKEVKAMRFEGEMTEMLFADLIAVPSDVFELIRKGQMPYRSVEIHKLGHAEIDSLALMQDEVPFFRMPLLTVKINRSDVGAARRLENTPILAYRALGRDGSLNLFKFLEISEMTDAQRAGHTDDEEKKKKKDEDADRQDMLEDADRIDDGDGEAEEIAEVVESIDGKLDVLVEKLEDVVEEEVAERSKKRLARLARRAKRANRNGEEEVEEAVEVIEDKIDVIIDMVESLENGGGDEDEATANEELGEPVEMSAKSSKAPEIAEIDVLRKEVRELKTENQTEKTVNKAMNELEAYGLSDPQTKKHLYGLAKKEGVKSVRLYVATAQRIGQKDPEPDFIDDMGTMETDSEEVRHYSSLGMEALKRARELSDEFDSDQSISTNKKTYIYDALNYEGLITNGNVTV